MTYIDRVPYFYYLLKGTRLDCRLRDHRPAGRPKNLKEEYTPKPKILREMLRIIKMY